MASPTKVHKTRKRLKQSKMGRERKNRLANHGSTPSRAELFGDTSAEAQKAENP